MIYHSNTRPMDQSLKQADLKIAFPGSNTNVPPLPYEADSSDLIETAKLGNLGLKQGPGGLSKENGYGLFTPTIYIKI